MGGHLLFNIEFPNKEMRDKFEKQEKLRRMFQYNGLLIEEKWYDCFYYPMWMGYAEPQDTIRRCKKNKIKIKKFLSIDISTNGSWFDEIKQEAYEEE